MPNRLTDDAANFLQTDALVSQAATKYGVDPELVHRIIRQESGYNPQATSKVGAQGLMQLMPPTAHGLGVNDPFDPAQNIDGGTKYFSQMLKRYGGDTNKALMAYNAGPGNVDSGKAAGFKETQDYVNKVGQAQPAPSSLSASASEFLAQPEAEQSAPQAAAPQKSTLEKATSWLPDIGGMIGGITGGKSTPMGAAMAAVGGAAGKGYESLINHATELPGALKDIASNIYNGYGAETAQGFGEGAAQGATDAALAGGKQAAYEVAGRALAVPVRAAGSALVKTAFKSPALRGAVLKQPELIQKLIEHGIGPNERGVTKAATLTSEARRIADDAVASIGSKRVPTTGITDALFRNSAPGQQAAIDLARGEAANHEPMWNVLQKAMTVLGDNGRTVPLDRVREIWRGEGRAAAPLFNQLSTSAYPALEKVMHGDLRRGAAEVLQREVPGLAALDSETALRTAMKKVAQGSVEKRAAATVGDKSLKHIAAGGLATVAGFTGGGPLGAAATMAATEAATNPTVQAAAGRALYKGARPVLGAAVRATAHAQQPKQTMTKAQLDDLYSVYQQQ